jgi:hypothetical protein
MFEHAVLASEALGQEPPLSPRELIPALSHCPACRRVRLIAAPMLGLCDGCERPLAVLGSAPRDDSQAPNAAAALAA